MTKPRILTDVELLAWSVVLAWRDRLRERGNQFILPSYPPCPSCGEAAIEVETYRSADRLDMSLAIGPCGHSHAVRDEQMERIHRHAADMIHAIDVDGRLEFGKRWTTDEIISEARSRFPEPEPADPDACSGEAGDCPEHGHHQHSLKQPGHIVGHATIGVDVAATQATGLEQTARVFAGLHRSAEADVSRVIDLYEQWVKAGPPPLGTSISRWWDARLVELHDAILPPAHETEEQS